jgi:hypothetical protein
MFTVRRQESLGTAAIAMIRVGVGATLLIMPDRVSDLSPNARVFARTVGARDIALGVGTLWAIASKRELPRQWVAIGTASDLADVAIAVASRRELGARGTAIAALVPLPIAIQGLRSLRRRSEPFCPGES